MAEHSGGLERNLENDGLYIRFGRSLSTLRRNLFNIYAYCVPRPKSRKQRRLEKFVLWGGAIHKSQNPPEIKNIAGKYPRLYEWALQRKVISKEQYGELEGYYGILCNLDDGDYRARYADSGELRGSVLGVSKLNNEIIRKYNPHKD